jgi:hypothetical protein
MVIDPGFYHRTDLLSSRMHLACTVVEARNALFHGKWTNLSEPRGGFRLGVLCPRK